MIEPKPTWRSRFPTIVLGIVCTSLLVFLISYEGCDKACGEWDYISDLLIENSHGNEVERWNRTPTIGVAEATMYELEMTRYAVYELNDVLKETRMAVRFTEEENPDILVRFISRDFLRQTGREFDIEEQIEGLCETFTEDSGTISSARILIQTSLPQGDKWGVLLHELGHALGITGHTDRYLSSLFYSDIKGGALSDGFSSDDKKLLDFLYRHLEPGQHERSVHAAFEANWRMRPE
ncbi:MAG: DUF2927 domain-containing protein [Kiloniellales bacterium]|nr:DUF2927 domain-containing protein [Kiloniellales bacterium]